MRKVEAIIRASKFQDVKNALYGVGVNFFSFWNVTEADNEHSIKANPSASNDLKYHLSIIVNDDFKEVTIKAILQSAFTGEVGDGRVFVTKIDEVYKIRTKEQGTITLR